MKYAILAALLGTSALTAPAAMGQAPAPQSGAPPQAQATLADCDRLTTVLEQRRPANAGVTVEQVRTFRTQNNPQACRDALVRLDTGAVTQTAQPSEPASGGEASRIVVQQPAPAIQVQQAAPQVSVLQPQPNVTVRQAQPEILVRQPQPTVTVDIPQPEVIVRMPQPDVNVAMAQPQVEVRQPQPQVQVVQPEQPQVNVTPAQPNVQVQALGPQPQVQVQQPEQQPQVRYERAEPKVVVNQAQGQPNVRIEQQGQTGQPAQPVPVPPQQTAGIAAPPATTGAIPAAGVGRRALGVQELENMNVYNAQGNQLGEVDDVLIGPNNQASLVVGYGGFLGLGERKVLIPLDRFQVQNDRLVVQGMSEDQLRSLPPHARIGEGYRAAENTFRTEVRR